MNAAEKYYDLAAEYYDLAQLHMKLGDTRLAIKCKLEGLICCHKARGYCNEQNI